MSQPDETIPAEPLPTAVREVEAHVASSGWDARARLFALAPTAELVEREPQLAEALGLDGDPAPDALTPVEQELDATVPVETTLESIMWPAGVAGCAVVVERLVLPPEADAAIPEDAEEAQTFAAEHPDRQEVRIAAGATRDGAAYCALRLRSHDDDQSVVGGPDLVPELVALLRATLEDEETQS